VSSQVLVAAVPGGWIEVKLVPEGRTVRIEVEAPIKVAELLRRVGMNPEVAVVIRNGAPLVETDTVNPGETVEVVRVLSGG
jgi:sulfur carrier protein ThiS